MRAWRSAARILTWALIGTLALLGGYLAMRAPNLDLFKAAAVYAGVAAIAVPFLGTMLLAVAWAGIAVVAAVYWASANPGLGPAAKSAALDGLGGALFNAMGWVAWLALFMMVSEAAVGYWILILGIAVWLGTNAWLFRRLMRVVRAAKARPKP